MTLRLAAILLMIGVLLAVSPVVQAAPLAQATATYTPVPTRTQIAATQSVQIITVSETVTTLDKRVTYGDVYIVTAIAVVAAGLSVAFAYSWVKGHIRVSE